MEFRVGQLVRMTPEYMSQLTMRLMSSENPICVIKAVQADGSVIVQEIFGKEGNGACGVVPLDMVEEFMVLLPYKIL